MEKLSRDQSWMNLLFSVLRDAILYLILDNWFSILDFRFLRDSRITNRDSQQTVNLLLNGTVINTPLKIAHDC